MDIVDNTGVLKKKKKNYNLDYQMRVFSMFVFILG